MKKSFIDFQKESKFALEKIIKSNDFEELYSNLKIYVYAKFMLDDENEEDLLKLALISIDKSLLTNPNISQNVEKYDCHNISSPIKKKILFINNLEKSLKIKFNNYKLIEIDTIKDLAEYCYELLFGQNNE